MDGAGDYRILRLTAVSGQIWIVDEREPAGPSSRTKPFYGWPEGEEANKHWMQRVNGLDEGADAEADRNHVRAAHRTGLRPELGASPFVHTPVDLIDAFDLYLVSEFAETNLKRELARGPLDADELAVLEQHLRGGLTALHALDLVHCDVREDNVFRVGGEWKLGDLGGVVGRGEPIVANQIDPAYRPSGVKLGDPAAPEHDVDALVVVLEHAATGRSNA